MRGGGLQGGPHPGGARAGRADLPDLCQRALDQQGSRRVVYLPFYRGVERLNAAARAVWEAPRLRGPAG